jgi:hypothetical protein
MAAADDDEQIWLDQARDFFGFKGPEDESRSVFVKSCFANNMFGMYTAAKVVNKDGVLLYYEFTFVRNPDGVRQDLGVKSGHKTIVRPDTPMGEGDFNQVTPDKIVTTVLRW